MNLNIPSIITKINSNLFVKKEVQLFLKRDDLIHNIISGNKWRKLKYNFKEAKLGGHSTILSFGGEYSNHLHALSYAANQAGFKSVGVIRGAKKKILNSTLSFCESQKMVFYYMDRSTYRSNKYSHQVLLELKKLFGKFYLIPEGGNNLLGIKGCQDIVAELDLDFDYVCCPVGTGCTASGIISSLKSSQNFIGFCAFNKTYEQHNSIINYCNSKLYNNWQLISDNHFGGFAKINTNLIKFVRQFYLDYNIELDLIYMGKLFYSLFDLIAKGYFPPKSKIVVLHTGGLQGLKGFNFSY